MSATTRPDAIMMPAHCGVGENDFDRLLDMREVARRHLRVNLDARELAYCRPLSAGQGWFCTRDMADTILFPHGHERAGLPRYDWADMGNGIRYGTLVAGAKPEVAGA